LFKLKINLISEILKNIYFITYNLSMGIGDWGLGIGDWGLGVWGHGQ
jgi:hypothetical protein